jgi:hypothetical protein
MLRIQNAIRNICLAIGFLVWALSASPAVGADSIPHEVSGFVLGTDISAYTGRVKMETALPVRYEPYIVEVETVSFPGFKTGLIGVGQCDRPGKILRIKMKYADSSPKHYDRLLEKFKERFGEPTEWRGDPFHIVKAWKWSFLDPNGEQISLTLQHNTLDQEEKTGNTVKLSLTGQIEREQQCQQKKDNIEEKDPGASPPQTSPQTLDWERCIPR